jgi:regulator of sigma E protease
MNILVFILTLSILVLIHEFGHFLAAKKRGVLVEEFGLGLPPRIAGIKIGETIYSINFLPFGGFVKLYGEDSEEDINKKLKSRAFSYKKNWEKFLIIVAGVVGNFLLAWLLFSYLFTQGVPVPTNQVKIEKVVSGSPAEKVGIVPGDVIKKIISKQDNKTYPLSSGADLITITKKYSGKEIILVVKRNNQEINKTITPRLSPPPGQGPLGIVISSFEEKKYPWYQAPFY